MFFFVSSFSSQTTSFHLFSQCRRAVCSIAFFGTPDVAASVLNKLIHAHADHPSPFEVTTVITKASEGQSAGSLKKVLPMAKSLLEGSRIKHLLTPTTAKDEAFLNTMSSLRHDLYITAAIGLILPQRLLDIPRLGTINIHPSILPRWRGASPVQRCLEAGDASTGVSLTYTVLKCDAGPVLETTLVPLRGDENAVDLQRDLFELGGDRLLARMDDIISGRGRAEALDQDESMATYASKIKKEEGRLDLRKLSASEALNKVRAFTGWPGTFASLILHDSRQPRTERLIEVDVCSSRLVSVSEEGSLPESVRVNRERVHYIKGRVLVPCREGMLEVMETRVDGRVRPVREFMASLGKHCRLSLT